MSRPTELTPELADRIAQLIRAGNWPETAAVAAGGSQRSYYRWMARGQKAEEQDQRGRRVRVAEEPFWQFWQQVKRAERESEAIAVGYLMKSMPHTPTAVTTFLERRFPQRWTRTERTELTGSGGGPVQVEDPTEAIIGLYGRLRSGR
jgi:hypothetical protein